jgi:hypothetical protein
MNSIQKNKIIFSILPFFCILSLGATNTAHAQGQTGHGGNGHVCFSSAAIKNSVEQMMVNNEKNGTHDDPLLSVLDKDILEVQLLDFYSARQPSPTGNIDPLITPDASKTTQNILDDRLSVMQNTNFLFYSEILNSQKYIPFDNHHWKSSEDGVSPLNDHRYVENLSGNCLIMQLAVQVPVSDSVFVVSYDQRLFNLMKPLEQAGLIWHEWTYNLFIRLLKDDTSLRTQYVLPYIFAKDFGPAKASEFVFTLSNLSLRDGYFSSPDCFPIFGSDEQCFYGNEYGGPNSFASAISSFQNPLVNIKAGQAITNTLIVYTPAVSYAGLSWNSGSFYQGQGVGFSGRVVEFPGMVSAPDVPVVLYSGKINATLTLKANKQINQLSFAQGTTLQITATQNTLDLEQITFTGLVDDATTNTRCKEGSVTFNPYAFACTKFKR